MHNKRQIVSFKAPSVEIVERTIHNQNVSVFFFDMHDMIYHNI